MEKPQLQNNYERRLYVHTYVRVCKSLSIYLLILQIIILLLTVSSKMVILRHGQGQCVHATARQIRAERLCHQLEQSDGTVSIDMCERNVHVTQIHTYVADVSRTYICRLHVRVI